MSRRQSRITQIIMPLIVILIFVVPGLLAQLGRTGERAGEVIIYSEPGRVPFSTGGAAQTPQGAFLYVIAGGIVAIAIALLVLKVLSERRRF